MLQKHKLRSVYSRAVHGNVIAIVDHDGAMSIARDADNVIADLAAEFDLSKYLVIFRDTRGVWDQIPVDRTGRFAGFSSIIDDGSPSISALTQARAAIARAKPETVAAPTVETAQPLPPDPEKMNGDRAEWAAAALRQFQCATGCDYEDSLGDLLCDLMHGSDSNNFDFEAALCRARVHYEAETAGGQP